MARAAAVALLGFKGLWRAFGTYLGQATNQQAEIAALGHVEPAVLQNAVDKIGVMEMEDEQIESADLF